jgi:hypothetical protein
MKKFTLLCLGMLIGNGLIAQVSFTNQGGLLGNWSDTSEVAVDMNGDFLDDYVRVASNGIHIDYQQANGLFNSVSYPFTVTNVPNWSIAAGDLDGNGYNDLVFGNGQRVSFVMANNDGTGYGEDPFPQFIFSQRSNMVDIDNDGDLDAFVCHDIDLSHPYRNNGSGTMTLDQSLIQTIDAPGNYASLWVDYDNDGDIDMYMTKCKGGAAPGDPDRDNAMYRNNGDGTFTEVGADIGMRDNAQSWSTCFEDFDNDGDFDAFIVNHDFQNRFMLNDGNGNFSDIIATTGINPNDLGAWENQAADFDNNGFVDIFSELQNELYFNNGDLTFTGVSLPFDEGAIGDFNNDGFLDVVNDGDLWINNGNSNNWVKIGLIGVQSNINGIGARISISGSWGTQIREVRSGQGFSHMSSLIAHFGLGTASEIEEIRIEWPSGTVDVYNDQAINTQHIFTEGDSVLGTAGQQADILALYPNPTNGIVRVNSSQFNGQTAAVVDVSGRLVLSTGISNEGAIDLSGLPAGTYFVRLQLNEGQQSFKVVKK